jgi:hypothetical protein
MREFAIGKKEARWLRRSYRISTGLRTVLPLARPEISHYEWLVILRGQPSQGQHNHIANCLLAERSRRGKRHRAQQGSINVLGAAPYGYRYVKKIDGSAAYYQVLEAEAEVVRTVFDWYTRTGLTFVTVFTAHPDEILIWNVDSD